MIVRERLLGEMSSLAMESKWEEALNDIMTELFEIRPSNVYLFLQKKTSLKQKMDSSKSSQYQIELIMYISHIDPLLASEQVIKDKIISLCVQKFQHTKIRKTEIMQLVYIILMDLEVPKKEMFAKILDQMLDREIYTILQYSDIVYQTVVFRAVTSEVSVLEKRLADLKVELNRNIFEQWINTVNQHSSITKQLGVSVENSDIFRGIAMEIAQKITL